MNQTPAPQVPAPAATPPAPEAPSKEKVIAKGKTQRTASAMAVLDKAKKEASVAGTKTPEAASKPVEATPPATEEVKKVAEPEKETKFSKKILEFQRREEKLKNSEAELTRKSAEITAREQGIVTKEAFAKNLKVNPVKALQEAGITFQEIADSIIADTKIPDSVKQALAAQNKMVDDLRSDIQKRDDEAAAKKKADEDTYMENTTKEFKGRLFKAIEDAGEKSELIRLSEAQNLVWDVYNQHWEQYGTFPDFNEALAKTEAFLETRFKKMGTAKRFAPPPPVEEAPPPSKSTFTTLTNGSSSGSPARNDTKVTLSKDQRRVRAAALIKFDS